jgi:hypothetical protein
LSIYAFELSKVFVPNRYHEKEATMKYTTHKLPTAGLDPNSQTSGQEFGEAGQERSLERGEAIELLQGEQDSSLNELEQELLSHADGVTEELDQSSSVSAPETKPSDARFDSAESDPGLATKKSETLRETD